MAPIKIDGATIVAKKMKTRYHGSITSSKKHLGSGGRPRCHPKRGRSPMTVDRHQQTNIVTLALLCVIVAGYVNGFMMDQNRSMVTATRDMIDPVHRSMSMDVMIMHAWKFFGRPTETASADGMPTRPTRRSATAREMT